MQRNLEDEIFGGESDLSDVEQDERRLESSTTHPGQQPSDDDESADRIGDSHGLPNFRKTNPGSTTEDGTQNRKNAASKNYRQSQPSEDPDQPALTDPPQDVVVDPDELRRQQLYARIDEAAGKNKRSTKRRRRGGDEDLDMMADEEVARLRARMLTAVTLDQEANEERRPATSKMVLLPLVTATMQKSHLETAILDNGVLEAVKKWLEPLPDRSLPALNIQRSLLQLLTKMSIDTTSLKSSELGKIVLFYTKCPRVDPSIKRLADTLVTNWLRPIIKRPATLRSRARPIATDLNISEEPSTFQSQSSYPPRPQSQNPTGSQRARIPETVHQAFQYAPMSQLESNQGEGGSSQNPALRKTSQKATAKKTREWARKVQEAKKGQRMG